MIWDFSEMRKDGNNIPNRGRNYYGFYFFFVIRKKYISYIETLEYK